MYLHCSRLTLCLFLVFIIDFSSLFLHVSPVFHLLPHLFTFYAFPIFYSDCISFPCFILFFLISLPPCLFLLNHIFSPFFFTILSRSVFLSSGLSSITPSSLPFVSSSVSSLQLRWASGTRRSPYPAAAAKSPRPPALFPSRRSVS